MFPIKPNDLHYFFNFSIRCFNFSISLRMIRGSNHMLDKKNFKREKNTKIFNYEIIKMHFPITNDCTKDTKT